MSPSVTPRPQDPMVLGTVAFAGLLTLVGTAVFVAGVWVCSRIWPELKP